MPSLDFWTIWTITIQGTNISPKNGILKMICLFPRWDMLIPWRRPPSAKAAICWHLPRLAEARKPVDVAPGAAEKPPIRNAPGNEAGDERRGLVFFFPKMGMSLVWWWVEFFDGWSCEIRFVKTCFITALLCFSFGSNICIENWWILAII